MKKVSSSLVGISVSALMLWLAFRSVHWEEFFSKISDVRLIFMPALLILFAGAMWIRALRWRYLLPSGLDLSTSKLFEAVCIGFFASAVLPLRAGEFVRPLYLSRFQPVSFAVGFASVIVERVFDVLVLMVMLGLSLAHISNAPPLVISGARALTILALVILLFMGACYIYSEMITAMVERVCAMLFARRYPHLQKIMLHTSKEIISGLRSISSVKELMLVVFWSLMLWLEVGLFYQAGLWAFGENLSLSLWVGFTVNIMIALAVAAPSAPGFIGTFQMGCKVALVNMWAFPENFAASYSVFIHAFQMLFLVLVGLYILRRRGLSLSELRTRNSESVPAE